MIEDSHHSSPHHKAATMASKRKSSAPSAEIESTARLLSEIFKQEIPVRSLSTNRLQSLWAGYGSIIRVAVQSPGEGVPSTLIIKRVKPLKGKTGDVGHERKLKSYRVEATWYQHTDLAHKFIRQQESDAVGVLSTSCVCTIPYPVHVDVDGDAIQLVLSDLLPRFSNQGWGFGMNEAKASLRWLAAFHACYWEAELPRDRAGDLLVWNEGSYWHLTTRWDEWRGMGREWKRLKMAAKAIDARIHNASKHKTLVHGDPKGENILFGTDKNGDLAAAFYDFQYVGRSYGSRDLVYIFVSTFDSNLVENGADDVLLRYYFDQLIHLLPDTCNVSTWEDIKDQYDLCMCDYVRFMAGWGMWGNTDYATKLTNAVLNRLDNGHILKTEEDYTAAVLREFPEGTR